MDAVRPWRRLLPLAALVVGTLGAVGVGVVRIAIPFYLRPTNRTYGTSLGYPALLRRLGKPLPVETTPVQYRSIRRFLLAEGQMASDSLQVPMVPVARVSAVYVQPGQRVRKGDLLAELDARKAEAAADAARLAFDSATAELHRVQFGTVVALDREQSERAMISAGALRDQVALLRDEAAMKQSLYEQQLLPKDRFIASQQMLLDSQHSLDSANLSFGIATRGRSESERMASNTVEQATLQWEEALAEVRDHRIVAPADGIVDRVLVHSGEFNPVSGTPAFVVAAGLWFEASFDQGASDDVSVDAPVEVHLAARPQVTFHGRVASVNSIVKYAADGPEADPPGRPVSTGGPEWPATFEARIELPAEATRDLSPGMTGLARATVDRLALAVPEAAMLSMSAGSGLLVIVASGRWELRRARYGAASGGWLQVFDGVSAGEKVIVEGQQVLAPGDRIRESPWHPPAAAGR